MPNRFRKRLRPRHSRVALLTQINALSDLGDLMADHE